MVYHMTRDLYRARILWNGHGKRGRQPCLLYVDISCDPSLEHCHSLRLSYLWRLLLYWLHHLGLIRCSLNSRLIGYTSTPLWIRGLTTAMPFLLMTAKDINERDVRGQHLSGKRLTQSCSKPRPTPPKYILEMSQSEASPGAPRFWMMDKFQRVERFCASSVTRKFNRGLGQILQCIMHFTGLTFRTGYFSCWQWQFTNHNWLNGRAQPNMLERCIPVFRCWHSAELIYFQYRRGVVV